MNGEQLTADKVDLQPEDSALMVVDMQKGFLEKDAPLLVENGSTLIPRIVGLLEVMRAVHIPVIWTRVSLDNFRHGAYRILKPHLFTEAGDPLIGRNTEYFQLVDELSSLLRHEDTVIDKDRYSAFYQTNLDVILRQKGIRNLIVSGITTNICVESTIRDAFQMDYIPILLSDCTMSFSQDLHEYALSIIAHSFGFVMTSDEFISKISSCNT